MKDFAIQPQTNQKGRSFRATCLAVATADSLWEEGANGKAIRPIWAMFAGTEQELRSFVANLKSGRKAEPAHSGWRGGDDDRLEFLRSIGFSTAWQRESEGTLVTIFHPELFRLDPGLIEPDRIRFALFVPSDWSRAQAVDVEGPVRHVQPLAPKVDAAYLESLVPTAYLFAAYLDRRTRCPLVADGRFYLQLLVASLELGFASLPGRDLKYHSMYSREDWGHHRSHRFGLEMGASSYYEKLPIDSIGLEHAITFNATHANFEPFLAAQMTEYFARIKAGKPRRGRAGLASHAI